MNNDLQFREFFFFACLIQDLKQGVYVITSRRNLNKFLKTNANVLSDQIASRCLNLIKKTTVLIPEDASWISSLSFSETLAQPSFSALTCQTNLFPPHKATNPEKVTDLKF